jgi:hypothetical protein
LAHIISIKLRIDRRRPFYYIRDNPAVSPSPGPKGKAEENEEGRKGRFLRT